MHQKKTFFFILLFFQISYLFSQNWDDYKPLKSEGKLPEEIITSASSKYKILEDEVRNNNDINLIRKKQRNTFHLESTFAIDELMKSGNVLYNDPIGEYVNKVADKLLEYNPSLRKELRFYVVRSSAVNAFATDRGSIFINIGLLARLETEAQLAFILAHEIVHVNEKHSMDSFLEYENIDNLSSRNRSSYDGLLNKSNYSQQLETEADEEGIAIFQKSAYSSSSLIGIYDILATSHTAFGNLKFDKSYFEQYGISIPDSLLLDSVNQIIKYEEGGELSSHPSVNDRRKMMEERFRNKIDDKETYLVGEKMFENVKKMAQFEMCNILLENFSFPAAIYHSYLLQKDHPNSIYLKNIVVKSLYGIAQHANANSLPPFETDSIQGEMQQVFHLLYRMDAFDLSTIAVLYTWNFAKDNPDDYAARLRAEDMIIDITKFYIDEPEKFFNSEIELFKDVYFTYGILDDLYKNEEFKKNVEEGSKSRKYYSEFGYKMSFYNKLTKSYEKKEKKKLKTGVSLGLEKTLFLNPSYFEIRTKSKNPVKYIKSEEKQQILVEAINKQAESQGFNYSIIDVSSLEESNGEKFNDIVQISLWLDEFMSSSNIRMYPSNHNEVIKILESYNTDNVTFIGALNVNKELHRIMSTLMAILIAPTVGYTTPLAVQYSLNFRFQSLFYYTIVDVKKLKILHENLSVLKMKTSEGVINAEVYWMIEQMKRKYP